MAGKSQYLKVFTERPPSSNTIIYGTSDPTINPAEVWMLAHAAARLETACQYLNYPLASHWVYYDLKTTFAPYPVPYAADPFKILQELGLPQALTARLTTLGLPAALASDTVLDLRLEEAVAAIRPHRRAQSFLVVNLLHPRGAIEQVFGERRDIRYRENYRQRTIGELLTRGVEKLGGAIIYFLVGNYAARNDLIVLLPHTAAGDVWGSVAAGAAYSGRAVRLWPIGGFDLLTARQWRLREKTKIWRKAPPHVIQRLESSLFRPTLLGKVLDERAIVNVAYDEAQDRFSFR